MINLALKQDIHNIVYSASMGTSGYDVVDNIILCCLVFQQVQRDYISKVYTKGTAKDEITQKYRMLRDFFQEKKKLSYAYYELRKLVESTGAQTFALLNSEDISQIISLYNSETKIVDFSSDYFDIKMYKLASKEINLMVVKQLAVVHEKIMGPISRYYLVNNRSPESGITIHACRDNEMQPYGKAITFTHSHVPNSIILRDTVSGKIHVPILYTKEVDHKVKIVTGI